MRRIRDHVLLALAAPCCGSGRVVRTIALWRKFRVCFCAGRGVRGADRRRDRRRAPRVVRVQAYGFSARPRSCRCARGRRAGARRRRRGDSRPVGRAPAVRPRGGSLLAAGVPVFIDHVPGIAHNKIIVIDRRIVVGGSYNYTASAERRNAENVTFNGRQRTGRRAVPAKLGAAARRGGDAGRRRIRAPNSYPLRLQAAPEIPARAGRCAARPPAASPP